MDKSKNLCVWVLFQRVFYFLWVDLFAPVIINNNSCATMALHILNHTWAKHTIAAHNDFITRTRNGSWGLDLKEI